MKLDHTTTQDLPSMRNRTPNDRPTPRRNLIRFLIVALATTPLLVWADGGQVASAVSTNDAWKKAVDAVTRGDFAGAGELLRKSETQSPLVEKVRSWLDDYETKQKARKELNKADFDKYVAYSKQRIERKEYKDAIGWALAAVDVAENRQDILGADWVHTLVNDALAQAEQYRKDNEWKDAWLIYSQLSALYETESRFQKLEREAVTHLRLEGMFKKGTHWEEYIERANWSDAKLALENIEQFYVEPADFKKIAEAGLEQMLLLAESKTAQETFAGLKDEHNRADFVARIKENLEQVRNAPTLDRTQCTKRFARVIEQINKQTVNLPDELIVTELMRGALEPLDEFTTMIWPRESDEFEKHTRGDFIGVGISIHKNKLDEVEVVTPLEDTPAYHAGIVAGDVILKVDGEPLEGKSINKVVETITGPNNTPVNLTIRRGEQLLEYALVRARVKIQSVKGWERNDNEAWKFWKDKENGIAYVRLSSFQRNTHEDLTNALADLQPQGMRGLILDLRGNPGGLLDSAWQISSLFLKRGDIVVSTKGRIPDEDQTLPARGDGPWSDLPLVVLVDDNSASASEIVSGAIRDDGRGIVLGERTFGKFSVQNLIALGNSRTKIKLTTARYYLPSGVSLHREPNSTTWGVEPQISAPLARKERFQVYALRREADMLGPQAPKKEKDADKGGDSIKPLGPELEDGDLDLPADVDPEQTAPKSGPGESAGKTDADSGRDGEKKPATDRKSEATRPVDADAKGANAAAIGKPKPDADGTPKADAGRDSTVPAESDSKVAADPKVAVDSDSKIAGDSDSKTAADSDSKAADANKKKDELPPLEQPDENNRPKEDPQVDAAVLLLRVKLIAQKFPTLATAETERPKTANP